MSLAIQQQPAVDRMAIQQAKTELCALGKTFGHIPNVPIFSQWDKRLGCSSAAVHRPVMAGVCGNSGVGVFSIVLSGKYADDEDGGDVIIYTGAGGRKKWSDADPPKRLRLGPQTMDQSWENSSNKAFKTSLNTGNPVRVVRSYKCNSKYSPLHGYRYDGLYKVVAIWTAKGRNGKNVCRFKLERLPDQPPIPLRPASMNSGRNRRKNLIRRPSTSATCLPPISGPEVDVKPIHLAQPPQKEAPVRVDALPVYKWDPKKHQLVRAGPDTNSGNPGVAQAEEEKCVEDDVATLIPSEDDVHNDSARTQTEYFSDAGGPDEPHAP